MKIAIVGAGIGGLSVAVGLQKAGLDVTVLEKAAEVRAGGSGLSIFANGLKSLESLGLSAEFEAVTDRRVKDFAAGQRRPDGRWITQVPSDSVSELRIVDRADLHRILLGALAADTIRTSVEVTSASADGSLSILDHGGAVTSEHTETFDLIIGADGLRSRVREAVEQGVPIRYSGYSSWRGITARPVDLSQEAGETIGLGRRFGIAPLADGRVYWFAVANMPENAVFHDEKTTVVDMFSSWHSPIAELIDSTPAEAIRRTPICDLGRPLASFAHGRIVLLGDAAHAMTPNLGQGGGQALEDTATLVLLLEPLHTGYSNAMIAEALARYDGLRRKRSQDIAKRSYEVGRAFQTDSLFLTKVRNALLRPMPPRILARAAESIQEFDPTNITG